MAGRAAVWVIMVAVGLAACSPADSAPPSVVVSGEPAPTALEAARAELDRALERLEATHPEPFHAVERSAFVAELDALKASLGDLEPEAAATELMRIWALLAAERDGHQFALPLDGARDPVLPIRIFEFAEGVFVTAAMPPHQDLVGARVTAVGDTPIAEALARIEPLVPRDGPATVPSFRPLYLLRAVVLRGLGMVGDGPVPLTLDADGQVRTIALDTVSADAFVAWAGPLPFHGLPPRDGLRHTQREGDHFRVEHLPAWRTVYVRYAQVQDVLAGHLAELRRLAQRRDVDRVVVDIRHNPGGNNFTYPPVVNALSDPAIDRPGRLVVLTDRVTFSAASNFATVVEQLTSARFAGEPMGGGLNFWDDVIWIELPDFVVPMRLAISTIYWEKSTPDDERLTIEPDLAYPVLAADYFAGRDPLLDAILAGRDPGSD